MNTRRPSPSPDDEEVNKLLLAAQDELLLGLSVNSHAVSSSDLDPDLARRFLALKSPRPPSSSLPAPPPQQPRSSATPPGLPRARADDELKAVLGDDLSARFAALRGATTSSDPSIASPSLGVDRSALVAVDEDEDEDEEDEVEKLLRWAKDAARLDPSPPSDSDDDVSDDVSTSGSDSDVENDKKKKGKS